MNKSKQTQKGYLYSEENLEKLKQICKKPKINKQIYGPSKLRGRKLPEETKRKISESHMGEKNWRWKGGKTRLKCENCKKVFFRKPSDMSENATYCSSKCHGESRRGKNSPNWKGGIKRNPNGYKYKQWRKSVFERDGYRCLICGKVGGVINAHHIKSWKDFPKLRYSLDNGMTMCEDCHKIVNKELPLFAVKRR